jgi:hypothetical protein
MNDKENNGDADTGIGNVERRPWTREGHMQIEEQKIDHVPVKHAVSQIPKHASKQERERNIAPGIPRPPKRLRTIGRATLVPAQKKNQREQ